MVLQTQLPLVSVIITNYNYGRYLGASIDSVLNQTYKNTELIVVDDGSSDNSKEVIESYKDKVIPIFKENGGMSSSRNAGFARAKGEIICFLDADDCFYQSKIQKVVEAFIKHPEWILVGHRWTTIDRDGVPTGTSSSDRLSTGDVRSLLLRWGGYASSITSASAYRRSALEKVMPSHGNMGIDSFLNSTLPFYGKVGGINEPLMYYRIHGSNIRAHSADLSRLVRQREIIANFINLAAEKHGLSDRFDIRHDVDYLVYKAIEKGGASPRELFVIILLSLRESWDIGRTPRDTFIRLITRLLSALPGQGNDVLEYGVRGYLKYRFKGKKIA